MSRESSIKVIEALCDPNSKIKELADIGSELCLRAIALNWKSLPDAVLETFRRLAEIEEKMRSERMF